MFPFPSELGKRFLLCGPFSIWRGTNFRWDTTAISACCRNKSCLLYLELTEASTQTFLWDSAEMLHRIRMMFVVYPAISRLNLFYLQFTSWDQQTSRWWQHWEALQRSVQNICLFFFTEIVQERRWRGHISSLQKHAAIDNTNLIIIIFFLSFSVT